MSQYKLTYFNARGRGEIIRLVFAAAGVEFEDIRLDGEQWPKVKPTTPFGQVPMLEVDGIKLAQSNSIARFLARRFGLAGKTESEQARVDMLVDCLEDTIKPLTPIFYEKDEARKAELQKKYVQEQLPVFLNNLEKLLTENNGGNGFFVGDSLTWVDLALLSTVSFLKRAGAVEQFEEHAKLFALQKRVESLPNVAAWLAKRPYTEL